MNFPWKINKGETTGVWKSAFGLRKVGPKMFPVPAAEFIKYLRLPKLRLPSLYYDQCGPIV